MHRHALLYPWTIPQVLLHGTVRDAKGAYCILLFFFEMVHLLSNGCSTVVPSTQMAVRTQPAFIQPTAFPVFGIIEYTDTMPR